MASTWNFARRISPSIGAQETIDSRGSLYTPQVSYARSKSLDLTDSSSVCRRFADYDSRPERRLHRRPCRGQWFSGTAWSEVDIILDWFHNGDGSEESVTAEIVHL